MNVCHCGKEIHKDRKYCSFLCRSADKTYCKKISNTKLRLYADPQWKLDTEDKKISTTLRNYGVEYPMQNIDIFSKQQASCFEKDENGLHGYEPYVYPFLMQLYPTIQLGTRYLKDNNLEIKWLSNDGKQHRSYPDFFVNELNSFIEIKSEYTRNLHTGKLASCAEALYAMKYGYYICIVRPNSSFKFEQYNQRYIGE